MEMEDAERGKQNIKLDKEKLIDMEALPILQDLTPWQRTLEGGCNMLLTWPWEAAVTDYGGRNPKAPMGLFD